MFTVLFTMEIGLTIGLVIECLTTWGLNLEFQFLSSNQLSQLDLIGKLDCNNQKSVAVFH
jgi:hypothetical protein